MWLKAWHVTGHIDKPTALEVSGISEDAWESCSLRPDVTDLADIIGYENTDEPSVADLIEQGRLKRKRVVWTLSRRHPSEEHVTLPHILVWPIEKRLANYVHGVAKGHVQNRPLSAIVISKKGGKEVSFDMLKKHTIWHADGTKTLKGDAPARAKKDQ